MDKKYRVVVTATWTYEVDAPDQDSAYEIVAEDLTKCTVANCDDGLYIEEPEEIE